MKAERFQHARALAIASQLGVRTMGRAIDLDDQLSIKRDEIDNVSIDRMLAAEFPMRKSAISQGLPQALPRWLVLPAIGAPLL